MYLVKKKTIVVLRVFKLDCAWTLSTPVWLSHVYPWHHTCGKCTRLPPYMVHPCVIKSRLSLTSHMWQMYQVTPLHGEESLHGNKANHVIDVCYFETTLWSLHSNVGSESLYLSLHIPVVAMPPTCEARWFYVIQHQSKLPSYHGLLASA